jgi:hypothetical protein
VVRRCGLHLIRKVETTVVLVGVRKELSVIYAVMTKVGTYWCRNVAPFSDTRFIT